MTGPRLTYANVIATLALFLSLGGGAYAALKLPAGSVGAKQLRKGAVSYAKISKGARTSLRKGMGKGVKGDPGARGPSGAAGARGPAGATGLRGLTGSAGHAGADGHDGAPGSPGDPGQDGAIGPSNAYSRFKNGPVTINPCGFIYGPCPAPVMSMPLAAGNYVIWAKTWASADGSTNNPASTVCTLQAGTDTDVSRAYLARTVVGGTSSPDATQMTLSMQVTHTFAAAGSATVDCHSSPNSSDFYDFKLTAIKVGSIDNQAG